MVLPAPALSDAHAHALNARAHSHGRSTSTHHSHRPYVRSLNAELHATLPTSFLSVSRATYLTTKLALGVFIRSDAEMMLECVRRPRVL